MRADVLLWAMIAAAMSEGLALIRTPELTGRREVVRSIDMGVLTVNAAGALIAGVVAGLAEVAHPQMSASSEKTKDGQAFRERTIESSLRGFKDGFVPVLTSYLAAVEHMAELLLRGHVLATVVVFVVIFIGCPLLFSLSLLVIRSLRRQLSLEQAAGTPTVWNDRAVARTDFNSHVMCLKLTLAAFTVYISLFTFGLGAFSTKKLEGLVVRKTAQAGLKHRQRPANAATKEDFAFWWELPCAFASVAGACLVNDCVKTSLEAKATQPTLEESPRSEESPSPVYGWDVSHVHWPTAVANAIALFFGLLLVVAQKVASRPGHLDAWLNKLRQSAGGTVSGFCGFAESVAVPALDGDWFSALANWAVNTYLATVGVALLWAISVL